MYPERFIGPGTPAYPPSHHYARSSTLFNYETHHNAETGLNATPRHFTAPLDPCLYAGLQSPSALMIH